MDCVNAFKKNEDKFYFRKKGTEDEENYTYEEEDMYNYKGVECPNCNVGFQIKNGEVEAECPMCYEIFIIETFTVYEDI